MADDIGFTIGQPVQIKSIAPQTSATFASRVISLTPHTLTVSMPYDKGKLLLWPRGSQLEITVIIDGADYTFTREIISRELGQEKSYTVMRPQAIARAVKEGMSRVIAVTSGKGGVGKTVVTINLAIALAARNKKVFVIDADLGTANIDILLRLSPVYNITHLLAGVKNLLEIAMPAPGNITVIPGGSGLQSLTQMTESQFSHVINSFNQLDGLADIILLDTGAGISRDVSNFLLAADETIVVTTPEPHAITDAYAIIKVMHKLGCQSKQRLIVNRAENQPEAELVAGKLVDTVKRYLTCDIEYIGQIAEDALIGRSLKQQTPLVLSHPQSAPARDIAAIAARLLDDPPPQTSGMGGFISKMFAYLKGGKPALSPKRA